MPAPDKGLTYRYLVLSLAVQQSHAIITGCYGKLFCQPPRLGWGSRNLNETDLEIDSAICSMMEALSPVDVNLCYSEAFQHPSSPNKKAEKFNIHLSMALLLKVLSKCNTCCQSWIEPRIVRKNREMAFRSIIKLCYKCHPSSGMEFMHTYYYPGNSKGSADPLAWKQYNLSFSFSPPTHSEPSNSKTQMCTIIYEAAALPILWRCCAPCPLTFFFFFFFFFGSGKAWEHCFFLFFFGRWGVIGGHCMFDMTLPLIVYAKPCSFECLSGWVELLGPPGFWHDIW